jgi:hypothetical protein
VNAPAGTGVYIENIAQFRRDLKAAEDASPRELTAALKGVGTRVILPTTRAGVPMRTGELAAGYKVSVRGTAGAIVNRVPYAAGAEWGTRGKWSGFNRYGGPGRFAWHAIDSRQEAILEGIAEGLRSVVELHGWAS